jgi:hypothetical protein
MANHKSMGNVQVKSAENGEVSAVFSTFNVADSDGDVTLPGAFDHGAQVVISSYNHTSWGGANPVGKGVIRTTNSEAILDGKFFMDTTAGRETFAVVKGLAESGLGEWSYGFETLDSEPGEHNGRNVKFLKRLKVFEVSPVLRGAGVNTRTLAVKALQDSGMSAADATRLVERTINVSNYKAAIRPHQTITVVKAWNGRKTVEDLPENASISDLRSVFAWADPNGDPESKASYQLPHHHGPGGEANLRACYMGIWALSSGKAAIPPEDRDYVYAHLVAHLQDADREPLELRAVSDTSPLKLQEEIVANLVSTNGLIERASEVMALRARKGKNIAATSADLLEWFYDDLKRLRSVLDSPQDDAAQEYARFIASLTQNPYSLPE